MKKKKIRRPGANFLQARQPPLRGRLSLRNSWNAVRVARLRAKGIFPCGNPGAGRAAEIFFLQEKDVSPQHRPGPAIDYLSRNPFRTAEKFPAFMVNR